MSEAPEQLAFDEDFDELRRLLGPVDDIPTGSTEHAFAARYGERLPEIQQKLGTIRARLNDAQQAVKRVTSELPDEKDPAKQSQLAVQALTALGTVEANVNDVAATADLSLLGLGSVATTSQSAAPVAASLGVFGGFINKVKATLGKINASLISFLAKYMTFQSWTVSGQLTGGVPWLSGSVTLALTFGP